MYLHDHSSKNKQKLANFNPYQINIMTYIFMIRIWLIYTTYKNGPSHEYIFLNWKLKVSGFTD